jgi:hypothetical protein
VSVCKTEWLLGAVDKAVPHIQQRQPAALLDARQLLPCPMRFVRADRTLPLLENGITRVPRSRRPALTLCQNVFDSSCGVIL